MNPLDKEANIKIMQEIGLEVGKNNQIIDQDTGVALRINGMDIMAPGVKTSHGFMEFDPYNNKKMANLLFSYYANKQQEETGVGVVAFYQDGEGKTDSVFNCRLTDDRIITAHPYQRDSLKYLDLMMQLTGEEPGAVDLSKYDGFPDKKDNKKQRRKKSE